MTTQPEAHPSTEAEALSINAVRMLAMDMVAQASSGHYGFPLGATPMLHTLFARHLRFDPRRPEWINRDRFVLSAGHGSAMLYAMLHVAGYDVSADDLRAFRVLDSKTPGHPERGETPGVEVTTGPLGQGLANAVGLAIAEEHLRSTLGEGTVDHRTWVIASDGDLMEGISYEAAAIAGGLGLDRLTVLYDDNDIVIDSRASAVVDAEGMAASFEALGWHVIGPVAGDDVQAIDDALHEARRTAGRPTLVRVQTRIGAGSPLEDDRRSHSGAPSTQDLADTRAALGLAGVEPFEVPDEVRAFWADLTDRVDSLVDRELEESLAAAAAEGLRTAVDSLRSSPSPDSPQSTRASSGASITLAGQHPFLIGGSADLAEATFAELPYGGEFGREDRSGRNIRFGVREHAMGAIINGISVHSVLRGFGSTFLMFATYQANAIRMAALQGAPAIYVFSHDSVLLGEDGPTHQPVEVLPFLRSIPGLRVWRPADAKETDEAWAAALEHTEGPSAIVLGRQNVPQLDRRHARGSARDGVYVARNVEDPELVLVSIGSELHLAIEAAEALDGVRAAVVSVPRLDSELAPTIAQHCALLAPDGPPRVLVEASHPMSWWSLLRPGDRVVGVERFGASAPASVIAEAYGLTATNIEQVAREALAQDA